MKILIVSEFFPLGPNLQFSGGVEARNFFISKHLAKKHEVTILTTRLEGTKSEEKFMGFNIVRVGNHQYKPNSSGILSRLQFIKESINVAKELNPDVVEGTNFITHFIALKISKNNKIPCIAWYPDVWVSRWVQNTGVVGILGEILERYNLSQRFNAYIAISKQTASKLEKYKDISPIVIPCGIEISEFKIKAAKAKPPQIITVSRLVKYKNIKDLILAFALLRKENHQISLEIIGRGPEEKKLNQLIKNLKLQNNIKFKSYLNRKVLITELKKSFIFCLPSSIEGFGIAALEASAAGIPCVLSDIEVFKEITNKWQGSLTFPVHNVYKIKSELAKLLTNKDLYEKKRKQAINLSLHYSWKDISFSTEKVYKSVLNTNR